MSKFDDAQVTGKYIATLVRRRALIAIADHDKTLGGIYERIAKAMRKDLLAAGYSAKQVRNLLDKNLAGTLNERVRVVEQAIHGSAREGRTLDRETFEAVFGDDVGSKITRVGEAAKPVFASSKVATKVASERIRGKATVDGLSLSRRFHKNDAEIVSRMGATLEASVRQGESITRTAERLLDEGEPVVRLPKYVQELSEAARSGKSEYSAAVKKWRSQVNALGQGAAKEAGEHTIRSATQQLVKDLGKAGPAEAQKAIDRWVLERARHQARVVARHEAVEAFRESSMESWREQEWVVAVKWTMSGEHPRPDICDVIANQDLYGLGAGCYPKDKVPVRHPSCLCTLSAVSDTEHFPRQLARAKGEAEPPRQWESGKLVTGNDWLRSQPASTRKAVAGPTRARLVVTGQNVMESAGEFKPVHELLGLPKPIVRRGPAIQARKLITADRADMVQPFPSLNPRVKETRELVPRRPAKPAPVTKKLAARPTKPKPKPTQQSWFEYGKPVSSDHAQLVDRSQAVIDEVRTKGTKAANGIYDYALDPDDMSKIVRDVKKTLGKELGLKESRAIDLVGTMPSHRPDFDVLGSEAVMTWDGQLLLRVSDGSNGTRAVGTLVHETIHSMGGAMGPAYRGVGIALEEIATEELAQAFIGGRGQVVATAARIPLDDVAQAIEQTKLMPTAVVKLEGEYESFRQTFYAVVSSATGETNIEQLAGTVRDALRRWKLKTYTSEAEALDGMVDALAPSDGSQREFYKRLLGDAEIWQ